MLDYVAPDATRPEDIVLFTKEGCSHCTRAKAALQERGLDYEEVPAGARLLRAVSGRQTTPQVFIGGEYVGGADELVARLG